MTLLTEAPDEWTMVCDICGAGAHLSDDDDAPRGWGVLVGDGHICDRCRCVCPELTAPVHHPSCPVRAS